MTARPHRVVIAGGGVAGLEALLALRALAGFEIDPVLVTPSPELEERPLSVAEPFGWAAPRRHQVREIVDDQRATLRLEALREVRVDDRLIVLGSGGAMAYDSLVVATGAAATVAVPGALLFRGREDVPIFRAALDDLLHGRARSLAVALPDAGGWSVPVYELAAMAGAELRAARVGGEVIAVTPERSPLELFGPAAAEALEPLLAERGVAVRAGAQPVAVEGGGLVLADGDVVAADRVVALPRLRGRPLPGLPADLGGFVPVDAHGRVLGCRDVYAAGDATASPLKQGGLAAQQADAVAEAIAARLGLLERPAPFRPVVRGLLLAGGAPLYMRAELGGGGVSGRARRLATASGVSQTGLWWPPAKIAARYLAPWLAAARPQPVLAGSRVGGQASEVVLDDRGANAGAADGDDPLALALLVADCDAHWGDYEGALQALEAAETLEGALPPAYERKRERWTAAGRGAKLAP